MTFLIICDLINALSNKVGFVFMDENKKWDILARKNIIGNKIFNVVEMDCYLPSKAIKNKFYSIHLRDWVNVFALTADKKVLFVKQHRMGKNIVTYEVPAGAIDEGEDPQKAAARELVEETGYTSDNIRLLKKISVNPAIQTNNCYLYFAENCVKTSEPDFDETEELEFTLLDLDDVINLENFTLVDNSLSMLAIFYAREHLKKKNII